MQTVRAFISSTWVDLREEREEVERILHRVRTTRFVGMEYFGSRHDDNRTTSLAELDACDLYIGIVGYHYGSGLTEVEYRRARERGLPCLIYIKDGRATGQLPSDDATGDQAPRLREWKADLRDHHAVSYFSSPSDLAAKVAADLHNFLFDTYLVHGVASVGASYGQRIQNFLIEYTGTPEHFVPFGGRDDYFAILNAWLEDARAVARLMLVAPAGRGKSALLVRWSRTVIAREDVSVVFFPVSIRFNTNLAQVAFPTIAARLAALHDEVLQLAPDASLEMWRGLVGNYLARPLPEGRRLLLILDGIDEAADWEATPDLFPYALAPQTKLIVSARYLAGDTGGATWLRRLGWDQPGLAVSMALDPLTHAGVADVLEHLGLAAAELSTRVDIVAELHRLSEGDPLLVRLYVEALAVNPQAAVRLAPEELQQIKPGLEGFFARWWDDQRRLWGAKTPLREPPVQTLLNMLACALGPLAQNDLLQLCPADSELSVWTLEDALLPIRRFVVGDGDTQGYAFSHPRLGSYFYERLHRAGEARKHESRYIAWGKSVLGALRERTLDPAAVSHYLIQYLRPHLERALVGVDEFRDLVTAEWRDAWAILDKGSFTGFLGDVRRVWQAAERADAKAVRDAVLAPFLDLEIRCALCLSSVSSIAGEIPAEFLIALVRQQVWQPPQGLAYASNIADDTLRVDTLLKLAEAVPMASRDQFLGGAIAAARSAADPGERDALLARVADELDEPLAALRHIRDDERLLESLTRLIVRQSELTKRYSWTQKDVLVDALSRVSALADLHRRAAVLHTIGSVLPEPERQRALADSAKIIDGILTGPEAHEHVLELAPLMPEYLLPKALAAVLALDRPRERIALARQLAAQFTGEARDDVLKAALDDAGRVTDERERRELLAALIPDLPAALLSRALEVASGITDGVQRAHALGALTPFLPAETRGAALEQLLGSFRAGARDEGHAQLLIAILPEIPEQLAGRALAAVQLMPDGPDRRRALRAVASLTRGRSRQAAVDDLVDAARVLPSREERARAFAELVAFADVVPVTLLFRGVRRFHNPVERFALLRSLPAVLTGGRLASTHARLVHELPQLPPEDQARELVALAPEIGDRLLWRCAQMALRLRDDRLRAETFGSLAAHLSPVALKELCRHACRVAESIVDRDLRAEVLCGLAWHLDGEERRGAFAASLAAVSEIESESDKAHALLAVARMLPAAWVSHAVSMARALPGALLRARTLAELAVYVDESQCPGVLADSVDAARHIADPGQRIRALRGLARVLTGPNRDEVIVDVLRQLPDLTAEDDRWAELSALIGLGLVSTALAPRALAVARDFRDDETRLASLFIVLPALTEEDRARVMSDVFLAVSDAAAEPWRAAALRALLDYLPGAMLEQVLALVGDLPDADDKAELLAAIVSRFSVSDDTVVVQAFETMARIPPSQRRNRALANMFAHVTPSSVEAALDAIRSIENAGDRAEAFGELGLLAPRAVRHMILDDVFLLVRDGPGDSRGYVLRELALRMPTALAPRAFEHARGIADVSARVQVLQVLASKVSEKTSFEALREAFNAVQDIGSDALRVYHLAELAPDLPKVLFDEALQSIASGGDPARCVSSLCRVASACDDATKRSGTLSVALRTVRRIELDADRIAAFLDLAPRLTDPEQSDALVEALRAVAGLSGQPDSWIGVVQQMLSLHPSQRVLHEAIITGLKISHGVGTAAMTMLAERLLRSNVARALVAAATSEIDDEIGIAIATLLYPHRADPPWSDTLDLVRSIGDESRRAAAVGHFLRHLPATWHRTALDTVTDLRDSATRADALVSAAHTLSDPLDAQALIEAFQAIRAGGMNISLLDRALARATQLAGRREEVLSEAVTTALAIPDGSLRAARVKRLAPHLPATLLDDALIGLQTVRDEANRAGALMALASHLSDDAERRQVLQSAARVARTIIWPERRASALAGIAEALDGSARDALLGESLAAVRIGSGPARADAFRHIAARIADASEEVMADAVRVADQLASPAALGPLIGNVATHFLPRLFAMGGASYANTVDRARLLSLDPTDPELRIYAAMDASMNWWSYPYGRFWTFKQAQRDLLVFLGEEEASPGEGALRREASTAAALCAEPEDGRWLAVTLWQLLDTEPDDVLTTFIRALPASLLSSVLSTIASLPESSDRARALCRVADCLPTSQLEVSLPVIDSIVGDRDRAEVLKRLLPLLPEPASLTGARSIEDVSERALALKQVALRLTGRRQEAVLQEAFDATAALAGEWERGMLLCELASELPAHLAPLALQSISRIEDDGCVAEGLVVLMPALEARHFRDVFSRLRRFTSDLHRALVLRHVALGAPSAVLREALSFTRGIRNPFQRGQVIEAFAPRLCDEWASDLLAAATGITSPSTRARTVAAIAAHSPEPLPADVLAGTLSDLRGVVDEAYRVELLQSLIGHAPALLIEPALRIVEEIRDEFVRADGLRALMPHVPETLADAVLDAVQPLLDAHNRGVLMAVLSERANPESARRLLAAATDTVSAMWGRYERAEALREIACRISRPGHPVVAHALSEGFGVDRPLYDVKVVVELAPMLTESLAADALRRIVRVTSEDDRVRALLALAPRLASPHMEEALQAGAALRGEAARRDFFCGMAPVIPESAWPAAIGLAGATLRDGYLADVLVESVPFVPESMSSTILQVACRLTQEYPRAKAFSGLSPYLTEPLVDVALDAVDGFAHEECRFEVLQALVPVVPAGLFERALAAAKRLTDPMFRARALYALAVRTFDHDALADALEAVCAIEDETARAAALRDLAPALSEPLRARARAAADARGDGHGRTDLRRRLNEPRALDWRTVFAPVLEAPARRAPRERANGTPHTRPAARLAAVTTMESESDRVSTLRDLAPHLPEPEFPHALSLIRSLPGEERRVEALNALAPYVPNALFSDFFLTLRGIRNDALRLQTFFTIAPRLAQRRPAELQPLWCDMLQFFSRRHRGTLLDGIHALLPAVVALGGQHVIRGTARSIDDVGNWWP